VDGPADQAREVGPQEHGAAPPTQAQLAEQAGTDLMMTSQVIRRLEGRALAALESGPR
jgi:hypothetical protein